MWYALCRILGEKSSVAFCLGKRCFLFSDAGVTLTTPYKALANDTGDGEMIWCLMGASDYPDHPDYDYIMAFSLMNATSPKRSWWKNIEKAGVNYMVFYMNPWTVKELEEA